MNRKNLLEIASIAVMVSLASSLLLIPQAKGQQKETPRAKAWVIPHTGTKEPMNMNPLNPEQRFNWPPLVYEPLALVDPVKGKYVPLLAQGWEWTDDYTLEVTIRPEAHFWNGDQVTAEDAVYSLRTLADPELSGKMTGIFKEIVKSLDIVDERVFRINVKEDQPPKCMKAVDFISQNSVCSVFDKSVWKPRIQKFKEENKPILEFRNVNPENMNATGAYQPLKETSKANFFVRRDDYWGDTIGLYHQPEYIIVRWFGTQGKILEFAKKGKVDNPGMQGTDSAFYVKWAKNKGKFWIYAPNEPPSKWRGMEPSDFVVIFNLKKHEIFRHKWFRKAMAYAMDYEAFVKACTTVGWPSPPFFLHSKLPWDEAYNFDIAEKYLELKKSMGYRHVPYKPEKAKQILSEHLEGNAKDGWMYKGEKVGPFKVLGWKGPPDVEAGVRLIGEAFKEVGIKASPALPEYAQWDERIRNMEFDVRWGLNQIPPVPYPIAGAYYESLVRPGAVWVGSKVNYQDFWTEDFPITENTADDVRKMINQLYEEPLGTEEYWNTVRNIQDIVIDQMPYIPLYQKLSPRTFTTANWTNYPHSDDDYPLRTKRESYGMGYYVTKYPRPKGIEVVSASAPDSVKVGETATVEVTLRNTRDYDYRYPVYLRKGEPTGWMSIDSPRMNEDLLDHDAVTIPAGSTVTVDLQASFDEPKEYTLTVEEWRQSQWDLGEPIIKTLTVESAEIGAPTGLENMVRSAMRSSQDAVDMAREARDTARDAVNAAEDAKTSAMEAKTAAEEARDAAGGVSASMLVASMIVTIIVVLAGVYAITRQQAT